MDTWYPAAQRDALKDAGPFLAGPYRGVLHTAEGNSYAGALAAYKASGNHPHFTVSEQSVWQHVALDRAATALRHPAGTVETNRQSCIQIEVVGYAAQPAWSPALVARVRGLMIWIEAQTGIAAVAPKFLPYPQSYGANTVRFSAGMWAKFGGWCGHMHVPNNVHGDPGAIDIASLLARGVKPMFDPPLQIVAVLDHPGGGTWLLGQDGGVFAVGGAPFYGSAAGKPYWGARKAAQLQLGDGAHGGAAGPYQYLVVATDGAKYGYPE